jgi:hypothetical protein
MTRIYEVGVVQRNLFGDLLISLRASPQPLFIVASDPRDEWLLGRLLGNVAIHRGTPLRGRVAYGPMPTDPENDRLLEMDRNGHLTATSAPLTPH